MPRPHCVITPATRPDPCRCSGSGGAAPAGHPAALPVIHLADRRSAALASNTAALNCTWRFMRAARRITMHKWRRYAVLAALCSSLGAVAGEPATRPGAAPDSAMLAAPAPAQSFAALRMMMTTDSEGAIEASGLAQSRADAITQGMHWLRKAAQQGDLDSQFQLGALHLFNARSDARQDLGAEDDLTQAVKWFTLAAEQGNGAAQDNLGDLYFYGDGTAKDLVQAYKWYSLAARQSPELQEKLASITGQMSAEQIDAAKRLAEAWLRAQPP